MTVVRRRANGHLGAMSDLGLVLGLKYVNWIQVIREQWESIALG